MRGSLARFGALLRNTSCCPVAAQDGDLIFVGGFPARRGLIGVRMPRVLSTDQLHDFFRCCPECGEPPPPDAPWLLCGCARRDGVVSDNWQWLKRAMADAREPEDVSQQRAADAAVLALTHTGDQQAVEFGTAALALLARRSPSSVHAAGGGAALVRAMIANPSGQVAEHACEALALLTSDEVRSIPGVRAAGGAAAAVLMLNHVRESEPASAAAAIELLWNLCGGSRANKERACKAGAPRAVAQALQRHAEHRGVAEAALGALVSMALGGPDCAHDCAQAGGGPAARRAVQAHRGSVKIGGLAARLHALLDGVKEKSRDATA